MDTIVALATPAGNSGVAVIRISGENSKLILQKMIKQDLDFEPRKMYLKNVYVDDIVDRCLVVFFRSPFSYTGEDVAEIQSHGGYFLAQKIIEKCMEYGARLATPGEFSKRAFINGKMSIDQAEGVMDLINAESDNQARLGSSLLCGELKSKIESYQNTLTSLLAEIEAKLDYPEYEYTQSETSDLLKEIGLLNNNLKTLVADSKTGLIIKNGVRVALVGAPNVGKSSLLNALTKSQKAIVTNIAGTTRDVVEAEYEYNGIIFRLFDTAGIHESDDVVERIGIDKAKQVLGDADIVLLISDKDNINDIKTEKPNIKVFNKCDVFVPSEKDYFCVSATENKNIDELKQKIFELTVGSGLQQNGFYLTNIRHIDCVNRAIQNLDVVLDIFEHTTLDIVSNQLKSAWLNLGEVSGVVSDEKIIDEIFAKFCLGK